MAETGARDEATTAADGQDKENAPDNVANPKRARKQTALNHIMGIQAAAKAKEFNPALDRTPDHLPSFEQPHPYSAGGGHCCEWRDRDRDNAVIPALILEDTAAAAGNIDSEDEDPDAPQLQEESMPACGDTDVEGSDCGEPPEGNAHMEVQSDDESQEMECDEGPAAAVDADGRVAIDLSRRPPNPLSDDPTFVSHQASVKSNPAHRDAQGNPKTQIEAAHVVLERLGHRFIVLDDEVKPAMWVCNGETHVWSCKPAAITNFLKECWCDPIFFYEGEAGEGDAEPPRKYFIKSQQARAAVQNELLNFCLVDPRAWSDKINRVPPGFVACADGFIDLQSGSCRAYVPADFMTSGGVDIAFKMPFTMPADGGKPIWNLDMEQSQDLYTELTTRMDEIMPDAVMQNAILGYMGGAMLHYGKPRKFLVLTGAGSNGKSALLDLLSQVFTKSVKTFGGSTDCPFAATSRSDAKAPNSSAVACKDRLIVATLDFPCHLFVDSGIIKNVTGDTSIDARELYKSNETIRTDFLTVFASNGLLEFTTLDKAVADRIIAFQMPSRFILEENATSEEMTKMEQTKELNPDDNDNPHHYAAEPGWQDKFKTPLGKMAIYTLLKEKYDALKDMHEDSLSRFDMSREYKIRATVPAQVAAYATPTAKSTIVSRSDVQTTFDKCMKKIFFITRNKEEDYETFGDIHKAIRELGVPNDVCSKAVHHLRKTLLPWVEQTEGVEVTGELVGGKKVVRGIKFKSSCPTHEPPEGYAFRSIDDWVDEGWTPVGPPPASDELPISATAA